MVSPTKAWALTRDAFAPSERELLEDTLELNRAAIVTAVEGLCDTEAGEKLVGLAHPGAEGKGVVGHVRWPAVRVAGLADWPKCSGPDALTR